MPSTTSENVFLRNLGKLLNSPHYQPQSIAAGADDPALLTVQNTGSAAVDDCIKAYNAAFTKKIDKTRNEYTAHKSGSDAYRQAIPALLGPGNMADFIACVTHGLVLGAIQGNDASRLIYAAQVAYSTMPQPARRPGRPTANPSEAPAPKAQNPSIND